MLAISLCRRAADFHKTFSRCNWCWPSSPSWSRLSRLQVAYYSVVSSTMTNMANIETTMVLKSNQEWISWAADALQLFESWRREVRQRDTNVNINVMIYVNIDINIIINVIGLIIYGCFRAFVKQVCNLEHDSERPNPQDKIGQNSDHVGRPHSGVYHHVSLREAGNINMRARRLDERNIQTGPHGAITPGTQCVIS